MPSNVLNMVMVDVDPAGEDAVEAWLHEDHMPELLEVPGWLSSQRYRAIRGEPKYVQLYDLDALTVLEQPEFLRTRPWDPSATSQAREMFAYYRNLRRGIYNRVLTLPDPEPGDLSAARGLLLVGLDVDATHAEAFGRSYDGDYLATFAAVPGVVRVRRFRCDPNGAGLLAGNPPGDLTLFDLERHEVLSGSDWQRATNAAETRRMETFVTRRMENVYERVFPA